MARRYKYQINSKRGIIKAVERPAGTTLLRESKGAYDPKTTYSKGDTVIYNGLYYTATTGTGIPGEGDGWELSGIVSAKGVTLSIRLDKPVLDITDGAKAVTATATATLGGQDITTGLPADGWRWTWRGKELSGETKSSTTLTDIPTEAGQYPVRVTHKLFGTYVEEQVVRVDVTTKLRAELEEALEGLRQSTGKDQAAMAEVLGKINKTLTSLQEQVDNEVSNWFYPGAPAPDRGPENEWITNQDKYRHIGDTYTSVDESGEWMGKSWRYTTEYKWQEIHDTLISKALSVAAKAQTTADGKSTTYYTQPSRYSVGDSWVLSADTTVGGKVYKKGTMLFASSSSDVYVGAHWGERLKYIDSAKLDADLKASEAKSKQAWEAYAAAKASQASADTLKAAKEYAEAQDAAHETRTKAYADKILTDKEQALIAAADAKAAAAETRAKAYADGKVTQAEQLAIDKAQKAYEDAVKRAKEMDSEIQVGGRNLAIMSRMIPGYLFGQMKETDGVDDHGRKAGDPAYKVMQYGDFVYDPTYYRWEGATPITYRIQSVPEGRTGMPVIHYHDKDKRFIGWVYDWSYQPPGYTKTLTPPAETAYIRICFALPQAVTKIERGTVATDWTPAPEDVQAEIDRAKEQATKAQTSTDNLRGYVDGAYKDGIITEVESKAIATYINEVEAMWSSAFGAYERVYQNALLAGAPKTALGDAKITLVGAKDNLVNQIKQAISDGKATKAEATETERLYNVYKGALRDFQRALKVAEEAIRDATVVEVGSGSLNYFPADVVKTDTNRALWRLKLANGFFRAVPVGVEVPINIGYDVYFANDRTDNKVKTTLFYTDEKDNYKDGSRRYIIVSAVTGLKGRTWHHIWTSGKVARLDKHVRIMGWLADTSDLGTYPSEVRDVYLRVGGRDLGWTPAPEDVQAAMEAVARAKAELAETRSKAYADGKVTAAEQLAIDKAQKAYDDAVKRAGELDDALKGALTQAIDKERRDRETAVQAIEQGLSSAKTTIAALEQAKEQIEQGKLSISDLPDKLRWIYDAVANGKTEIEGGLILSKYIGLSNSSGNVTSYMSGQDGPGAHMLAAGVSSLSDQNAVSYIDYDGSAKFGDLAIDKSGWVMIANAGRDHRLAATHISNNAVSFEDRTGGRWRGTKARIGMTPMDDGLEIILDEGARITLGKRGVHISDFDDRVMPRVLAHGKFDITGRLLLARSFGRYTQGDFSCSRLEEGKYKLTFPPEWINQYTLVFQGTDQDSRPGYSARFVSFGPATQEGGVGYVYVFGADDSTLNDVAVYFQIIAM